MDDIDAAQVNKSAKTCPHRSASNCVNGMAPGLNGGRRRRLRTRGSVIILVLVALVVVFTIAAALMDSANASFAQTRHMKRVAELRALADAGAQWGYWQYAFNSQPITFTGTDSMGPGSFSVTDSNYPTVPNTMMVVSKAFIGNGNVPGDLEYYTVVRIFDTSSNTVPAAPYPLTGFGGKQLIKLQWPSTIGALTYNIYRGTQSNSMSLIKSGLSTTTYIDTGLKSGTTYYYWTTSVNNTGESAHSNQISVKARNALMYVTVTGGQATSILSGEGLTDWAHWGLTPMDHSATGGGKIPNLTQLGGTGPSAYTSVTAYSWSNGSPTASVNNTTAAYSIGGTSAAYTLTLPADTTTRVARVYVGADACSTTFTVSISDGSTKAYSSSAISSTAHEDGIFSIVYSANSSNQSITINFSVKKARPKSATPKLSLQAVTMY